MAKSKNSQNQSKTSKNKQKQQKQAKLQVPPRLDLQGPGDQIGGVHDLQMLNDDIPRNLPGCLPVDRETVIGRQTGCATGRQADRLANRLSDREQTD